MDGAGLRTKLGRAWTYDDIPQIYVQRVIISEMSYVVY